MTSENGFASITEDGYHILIWDFDTAFSFLYRIRKILSDIQTKYNLSDIYIIQSRSGYNALCLDKLPKEFVFNIKQLTSCDDRKHLEIGFKRDKWILRLGDDKTIIEVLHSENTLYKKSNAHRQLLNAQFDKNILKDENFDDYNKLIFEKWVIYNAKKAHGK